MWTWNAANLVLLYHEGLVRQSVYREHVELCLGWCGFGSTHQYLQRSRATWRSKADWAVAC